MATKRKPKTLCPLERIYHLELALSEQREQLMRALALINGLTTRLDAVLKPQVQPKPQWVTSMLTASSGRRANNHPLAY